MKVCYCVYGQEPKLVPMVKTDQAFVGPGDESGYTIAEADDLLPVPHGEWLALSVQMALYEGGEASGSYRDWCWALVAETLEDAQHLRKFAKQPPRYW